MKALLLGLVSALSLTLSCPGCPSPVSFEEVPKERTALCNGFASYQNIEEVQRLLGDRSLSREVIEDSHLAPGDRRPPFNIYIMSVKRYSHLGHSGELQLHFFNNRLMETRFFPLDFNAFLTALAGVTDIELRGDSEVKILPHTRVWASENYKYVGWEDVRLAEEMKLWIGKYS